MTIKFVAAVTHNGRAFFFRSTTTTDYLARATRHDTAEAAADTITKAKKFNKAAVMKTARVMKLDVAALEAAEAAYNEVFKAESDKANAGPPTAESNEAFRSAMQKADAIRDAAARAALSNV